MAIKASATITISCYRDVESITRYYKLQVSTLPVPAKPTTKPPEGWVDSEPNYVSDSTKTLYFVDLTVFSNGEWNYSNVSVSSSYEAAKEAYNKATATDTRVENLEKEVDSKCEIWFYPGEPMLDNLPVINWDVSDYGVHVKDMYYDTDTGYAYRFEMYVAEGDEAEGDEVYYDWERIQDSDTIQALALANSAKDTADGKRRVFTMDPYPPYDNGDLWLHDKEIYVCQISKDASKTYVDGDFIIGTKYTDDTYAKQVGDSLEIVRGTVATITESVDKFQIEFETTVKTVDTLGQTVEENTRTMQYNLDTEDFTVSKSGADTTTHISEDGLRIKNSAGTDIHTVNSHGTEAENLYARRYLMVGTRSKSRFEDYEEDEELFTGVFFTGH